MYFIVQVNAPHHSIFTWTSTILEACTKVKVEAEEGNKEKLGVIMHELEAPLGKIRRNIKSKNNFGALLKRKNNMLQYEMKLISAFHPIQTLHHHF